MKGLKSLRIYANVIWVIAFVVLIGGIITGIAVGSSMEEYGIMMIIIISALISFASFGLAVWQAKVIANLSEYIISDKIQKPNAHPDKPVMTAPAVQKPTPTVASEPKKEVIVITTGKLANGVAYTLYNNAHVAFSDGKEGDFITVSTDGTIMLETGKELKRSKDVTEMVELLYEKIKH